MEKIFRSLLVCLGMLSATMVQAKVELPDIFSSHMVLQQNTDVRIWGKAEANTIVRVKPSWTRETFKVRSDASGHWNISISTPVASYEQYSIVFDDGKETRLDDVLVGEVWFCSGQSNMEMPLNGFQNCPVYGANEVIATSGQWKGIRMATVPKTGAVTPQEYCTGIWKDCQPYNARWFSATGFFFARMMNQVLDVPVGIINCSWGGSRVEGWLPEDIVSGYKDIDIAKERVREEGKDWNWLTPTIMYNGMLHPLVGFTVKGFLWYQGESNVGSHVTYAERLATLAACWREQWGQGELPFYYVEIAPYEYGEGLGGALLREAQYHALSLIPNSGMICTNDLVEPYEACNIHPKNKREVGERLAFMALNRTYGYKDIECEGPRFRSMKVVDSQAIIEFDNASDGFSRMKGFTGFEVAGEDRVFHPAVGEMVDNTSIRLVCDSVTVPVAVRYGFGNYKPGNVASLRGLPLYPFRTDNWN